MLGGEVSRAALSPPRVNVHSNGMAAWNLGKENTEFTVMQYFGEKKKEKKNHIFFWKYNIFRALADLLQPHGKYDSYACDRLLRCLTAEMQGWKLS